MLSAEEIILLIQSSSAATGVMITMVGTKVLPLDLALFIVLGANIGTCVTALLASVGANANSKRVALDMLAVAKESFDTGHPDRLPELTALENQTDEMKRALNAKHFSRLSEGNCSLEVSPYYTSTVAGLARVADHIVNVGYSICNPIGSQND